MFGCGDDLEPNDATLDLLETYAEEFVTNLVVQASRRSSRHGSNSLRLGDILHVIKKDNVKFMRMPYIITTFQQQQKTLGALNTNNKYCDDDVRKNLKFA